MKVTLKNFALVIAVLATLLVVLTAIDNKSNVSTLANEQCSMRVEVTDLYGNALHNCTVTVQNKAFYTDNKGTSPVIDLSHDTNTYDQNETSWFCVTVKVEKQGYVPAFVFNAVVNADQMRTLNVRLYKQDESQLPYVCYVESPPDSYVKKLLEH